MSNIKMKQQIFQYFFAKMCVKKISDFLKSNQKKKKETKIAFTVWCSQNVRVLCVRYVFPFSLYIIIIFIVPIDVSTEINQLIVRFS